MPLRTKGLNLSGAQGFYEAGRMRVQGSENTMRARLGLGDDVARGIGQIRENKRREVQDRQTEQRLSIAETQAKNAETRAGAAERRTVAAEDARKIAAAKRQMDDDVTTLKDLDERLAMTQGYARDLETAAVIEARQATSSGGQASLALDPEWQKQRQGALDMAQTLQSAREKVAARVKAGGGEVLPDVRVLASGAEIDPNDPRVRLGGADEMHATATDLAQRARKTGSRFLEVRAARAEGKAKEEERKVARLEVRQTQDREDAAKAAASQQNSADFWAIANLPQFAGVPKTLRAKLAVSVMQGAKTSAEARAELVTAAGGTQEYGTARGGSQGAAGNARRGAQELPTAGAAREEMIENREEAQTYQRGRHAKQDAKDDASGRTKVAQRQKQAKGDVRFIVRDTGDDRLVDKEKDQGKRDALYTRNDEGRVQRLRDLGEPVLRDAYAVEENADIRRMMERAMPSLRGSAPSQPSESAADAGDPDVSAVDAEERRLGRQMTDDEIAAFLARGR
jgi:hypothetical protein